MESTVINASRWHRAGLLPVALASFVLLIAANTNADARPPLGEPNEFWVTSSAGDTFYVGQAVEMQFYIANSDSLWGISLTVGIYSPDEATWAWIEQPDGHGLGNQILTLVPGCRFVHDNIIWELFVVETRPIPLGGGPGEDTIGIGAISFPPVHMAPGPLEHMMSIHLRPTHSGTICVDSSCIPPCTRDQWLFNPGAISLPWPEPICFTVIEPPPGDINCDGQADVGDAVYMINWIFRGGPGPFPPEAGDINCDDTPNVGDAVYLINWIFKNGPAPCR